MSLLSVYFGLTYGLLFFFVTIEDCGNGTNWLS